MAYTEPDYSYLDVGTQSEITLTIRRVIYITSIILINLDIMIDGFDQIKIKIKHYRIFLTCIPFVHQFVPIFLELYISNFCSW